MSVGAVMHLPTVEAQMFLREHGEFFRRFLDLFHGASVGHEADDEERAPAVVFNEGERRSMCCPDRFKPRLKCQRIADDAAEPVTGDHRREDGRHARDRLTVEDIQVEELHHFVLPQVSVSS